MRLRRRLAELEARVEALEGKPDVDYTMPGRHDVPSVPVEPHSLRRERCTDYAEVRMYDVDDDRAFGLYL